MPETINKVSQFKYAVGQVLKEIRTQTGRSLNKFALEYDLDRGNLSKIERGITNCRLITAWKIAEAAGISFVDFARLLEAKLSENFKLTDE